MMRIRAGVRPSSGFTARTSVILLPAIGLAIALGLVACDRGTPTEVVCDASLRPSIIASARDNSGRAAAVGATLTLVGIGVTDVINNGGPAKGFGDSLIIFAGGNNVSGPMDVTISKPWHNTSSVRGLRMATGPCGVIEPVRIGFTLRRATNAPPLRQVVVDPSRRDYSRAGISEPVPVVVLADDSVSHEVTWTSRDPAVVTITSDGLLTTRCRSTSGTTYIVASSVVNTAVRDSVAVTVAADPDKTRCPA